MNPKKKSARFGLIGLEVFSIVFAVLLALGLDSWQEGVKKQKQIDRALEDIISEVSTFTVLDRVAVYNQEMLDSLNSNIQRHEEGKSSNFQFGLGRPEIKSLAWSTAQSTGIASEIDRSLLLELAEIYSEYDRLNNIFQLDAEFRFKSDPDMPEYKQAKYIVRHLNRAIFRMNELNKKAGLFLEKHKDEPFVKALD